jgi:hypothetical protein
MEQILTEAMQTGTISAQHYDNMRKCPVVDPQVWLDFRAMEDLGWVQIK